MSASKSPKRRVQGHPSRHYERMDRRDRAEVRTCCPTSIREPHMADCTRPSNCRDKKAYSTRDAVRRAIGRMTEEMGSVGLVPYHCRSCGAWHAGHPQTAAEGLEE